MSGSTALAGVPVTAGVGRIPGFVNSYTFSEGEQTYLIDAGFSRNAGPIVHAFQVANVPLTRIQRLLLTHHHLDHRGGAAFLLAQSKAPISCHAEDAPFVDGRVRAPGPLLMRLLVRTRPAPVASLLQDGDRVGPLTVVHLPGHTPGEVAFHHPERRLLFSGDSVVEREGRLTLPAPRFAANLSQAVRSLDRLRALEVETLLPGHGVPVTKGVRELLDDLIRRAPTEFSAPTTS